MRDGNGEFREWKNKKQIQIQGVSDSFIAKDDIEIGVGNVIPLYLFGLLY